MTLENLFEMLLPFALTIELITSTNTNNGAILFKAPTKIVPNKETNVSCGKNIPNNTPINSPKQILIIRL